MNKRFMSVLAFALALTMIFSMVACKKTADDTDKSLIVDNATGENDTPLVVAYSPFNQKFSSFFADTAYDMDVASMTQIPLLTTDRAGSIIYNAIDGETVSYNGTDYTYYGPADIAVDIDEATGETTYTIKLREDVKFADGEVMTADDVIFNYYVYLDPSYVGSSTLSSYDIVGLQDYRTQTTADVYAKYSDYADQILAAGPDHEWTEADGWDAALQEGYWAEVKKEWINDVSSIVNTCVANYLDEYAEQVTAFTASDIRAEEGMQVMFGMVMWGFGEFDDAGNLFGTHTGETWDIDGGEYPTLEDFYNECYAAYEGDPAAYWAVEAADETDVVSVAKESFIKEYGSKDEEMSGTIDNIAGIKKVDEFTVTVTTETFNAPAIYQICGIEVCPMHYYGDPDLYDYENNMFGHEYGDLSIVKEKTAEPMGAGPYKFVEFTDKVVYFEANENYFKGEPATKYVQFIETDDADKVAAVQTGKADIADPSASLTRFAEIRSLNSDGELTGDMISTSLVDNLGYGYIGMNADMVKVGDDPASEQSKDLRKGLATIIAAYRDMCIDSYYGDMAEVINYPISSTSWAAPQKSDSDYKVAYSTDVDGNDIYTADMDNDAKFDAALEATKNYLIAAGYTFDEATGKFTAAPEGASLEYEVMIPGDGIGDHPNFAIFTNVADDLATIGITLTINDLVDSTVLWDRVDAGTQEIWTAAWGATIDPDMYQVYHSTGIVGRGGSESNHYHLDDPEMDELLVEARTSADQDFRKSVYKECLDIILDWAVEIPAYQRQNLIVFSTERVDMDTVTPDITTYYTWLREIENIVMY